jgi:hypothetical protein
MKGIESNRSKDLKRVPAEQTYKSPEDRVAAIKAAYTNHYSRLQDAQNNYEAKMGKLQGSEVGHNSWADDAMNNHLQDRAPTGPQSSGAAGIPPPAAAAAGVSGTPSAPPAKSAAKTASMEDVKAYATKFKMAPGAAIKAFQTQGYTIAQGVGQ